jgi:hypothetical protein
VTRLPDEVTIDLNPDDLIDMKGGDEVSRVSLTMAGERIAIMQKFLGGYTLPRGLPDISQEQASQIIETAEGGELEKALRQAVEKALKDSTDRCARCKVCDAQVDAVMAALGYPPKNAN